LYDTGYDSLSAIVYSIESGIGGATIQNFLADGIVATEDSFGVIAGIGGFTLAANPTGNANRVGYSPTTDQGRFFGFADPEADDDHRLPDARCGVDVLDAGHLHRHC
jgi:hypothetical protein